MAKTAKKIVLKFMKEKETKNAVRYQEQPEEGVAEAIGSLYVKKHIVGDADEIKVTVEV